MNSDLDQLELFQCIQLRAARALQALNDEHLSAAGQFIRDIRDLAIANTRELEPLDFMEPHWADDEDGDL